VELFDGGRCRSNEDTRCVAALSAAFSIAFLVWPLVSSGVRCLIVYGVYS
jgi:hypothetical protein